MKDLQYKEITCNRGVQGNLFGLGEQIFNFNVDKGYSALMNRSTFRALAAISKTNGQSLDTSDDVSWAPNPMSCIYETVQLRCGSRVIAEYTSGNLAVVDTFNKRVNVSRSKRQSTLKYTEWFDADYDARRERVKKLGVSGHMDTENLLNLVDDNGNAYLLGTDTIVLSPSGIVQIKRGGVALTNHDSFFQTGDVIQIGTDSFSVAIVQSFAVALTTYAGTIYEPSVANNSTLSSLPCFRKRQTLSLGESTCDMNWMWGDFQHHDIRLPSGSYSWHLFPYSDWAHRCVQSSAKNKVLGTDYGVSMLDIQFMLCVAKVEPTLDFVIDASRYNAISTSNTTTLTSYQFKVEPSTRAIAVITQSINTGYDTRYPASLFIADGHTQREITNLDIQFRGKNSNNPPLTGAYDESDNPLFATKNYLYRMWQWALQNNDSFFDDAGCETFEEWLGTNTTTDGFGNYYYANFDNHNGKEADTTVLVRAQYAVPPTNCVIGIISVRDKRVQFKLDSNGFVEDVMTTDHFDS